MGTSRPKETPTNHFPTFLKPPSARESTKASFDKMGRSEVDENLPPGGVISCQAAYPSLLENHRQGNCHTLPNNMTIGGVTS